MNDIELAARISTAAAESLAIAKEAIEDYPEHCLVKLRAMCKLICQEIVKAKRLAVLKSGDLADLISKIVEQLKPDQQTKHALHTLRGSGNKGAHSEEFRLSPAQFTDLAHSALSQSVTVLKFAYYQLYPDVPLPPQIQTTPIGGGLKSLCYKATIDENADAQYLIGMRFLRAAETLHKDFYDPANHSTPRFLGQDYYDALEKSRFWFKSASMADQPCALYEYGRALAEGKEGESLKNMGLYNIHRAAEKGDANANNFVGNLYCQGLHEYEIDYATARTHFVLAAEEDHPEALFALAEMYRLGKGVAKAPKCAFEYIQRSAEAGYPKAQFQMYKYCKNETVTEKDEDQAICWLKSSSDQKFWPAMYQLAEYIVQERINGYTSDDAEELFRRCLNSIDIEKSFVSKASLNIASIRMLNSPTLENIGGAVQTIMGVFCGTEQISDEIREMGWRLHERADALLHKFVDENGTDIQDGHVAKMILDSWVSPLTNRIRESRLAISEGSRLQVHSMLTPIIQGRRALPGALQSTHPVKPNLKLGRNELCSCGSMKKYKKCHGR
jgi:uncharacterized protein